MTARSTPVWFSPRTLCFLGLITISIAFAWRDLVAVVRAALQVDQYTHILIIVPLSVALIYLEARSVFQNVSYAPAAAAGLVATAAVFAYFPGHAGALGTGDVLSLSMFCFAGWWISAFVLAYGRQSFRKARFPLLLLLLLVPVPSRILDWVVSILQNSSADVTYWLMRAAHVPVFRRDVILSLPGIDIEVAKECSGIRSSLMLLIVSLVLAHLFLRTGSRKILLSIAVLPITVFKNALRIFTLSTLAVYVDPSFLTGRLHEYGGIPFFVLALGSLLLVLWGLQRSERKKGGPHPQTSASPVLAGSRL